jgi:ACS family hexuronate transporter-like MFS transporter
LTTKVIQQDIPLSDNDFGNLQSLFYFAYALMYVGGGKLMDLLGSRRGFLLIVVWWSLAIAGHGLAGGLLMLAAARLMLGLDHLLRRKQNSTSTLEGSIFPVGSVLVHRFFGPTLSAAIFFAASTYGIREEL